MQPLVSLSFCIVPAVAVGSLLLYRSTRWLTYFVVIMTVIAIMSL